MNDTPMLETAMESNHREKDMRRNGIVEFSDLNFLFRFLPIFLIIYYISPVRYKNLFLLAASILFYALGDWKHTPLLLGSMAVNYTFVRIMDTFPKAVFWRRSWLMAALLYNVGILCYFKYCSEALPLGISFYTFTMVSYDIDVYLGRERALRSRTEFGTFSAMFPKLLSGPIVSFRDMAGQLHRHATTVRKTEYGLSLLILGLSYKVLLADVYGILWHDIRTVGFESISTPLAWMGAAAYSAQLFFDFQGYSLMAIGLANMLGFEFSKNFDHPYRAGSVSEYYRRWHISLGHWFRDYLYIPLGGNRAGMGRTCLNLLVVWAVTGIWHGSTANFLLWGMVLGALILMERLFLGAFLQAHKALSHLYVWFVIPLTWIIFAITDLDGIGMYFTRLFPLGSTGIAVNPNDWIIRGRSYFPFFLGGLAVSCPLADRLWEKYWDSLPAKLLLFALFWICIYQIANGLHNPFMYLNF